MSKTLLKKTCEFLGNPVLCGEDGIDLYEKIQAELEKPDPEPIDIDWPDYHSQGMGCGLEDRGITDRYDAMEYGWYCAIERVAEALPEKIYTEQPDQSARIAELQEVCAEAYQFAGAYNAPDSVLDKLFAAANGYPIPKETYLPIQSANERIDELEQQLEGVYEILSKITRQNALTAEDRYAALFALAEVRGDANG